MIAVGRMCPACQITYANGKPDYFGSNPRCGFPDGGRFTSDNWQCATLDLIRDACGNFIGDQDEEKVILRHIDDQRIAFIPMGDAFDDINSRYGDDEWLLAAVVTWYKRRGRTENVQLIFENGESKSPTAQDVVEIAHLIANEELRSAWKSAAAYSK